MWQIFWKQSRTIPCRGQLSNQNSQPSERKSSRNFGLSKAAILPQTFIPYFDLKGVCQVLHGRLSHLAPSSHSCIGTACTSSTQPWLFSYRHPPAAMWQHRPRDSQREDHYELHEHKAQQDTYATMKPPAPMAFFQEIHLVWNWSYPILRLCNWRVSCAGTQGWTGRCEGGKAGSKLEYETLGKWGLLQLLTPGGEG